MPSRPHLSPSAVSRGRRGVATASLAAATLLISGCSLFGLSDGTSAGSSGASAESAESSTGTARVQQIDTSSVSARQTVTLPQSARDSVEVGVHSLTVRGEVMVLRLIVTPRFGSESDDATISLFDAFARDSLSISLLDAANFKRYRLLRGGPARQEWASDAVGTKTRNGTPMVAEYYFAAPEDPVEAMELRVTDWMPPFLDVTITR